MSEELTAEIMNLEMLMLGRELNTYQRMLAHNEFKNLKSKTEDLKQKNSNQAVRNHELQKEVEELKAYIKYRSLENGFNWFSKQSNAQNK